MLRSFGEDSNALCKCHSNNELGVFGYTRQRREYIQGKYVAFQETRSYDQGEQ